MDMTICPIKLYRKVYKIHQITACNERTVHYNMIVVLQHTITLFALNICCEMFPHTIRSHTRQEYLSHTIYRHVTGSASYSFGSLLE